VLCCVLQVWRHSTFTERRQLLKVLLKYIINHQQEICRCVLYVDMYEGREGPAGVGWAGTARQGRPSRRGGGGN
jgi:hypothetical protein